MEGVDIIDLLSSSSSDSDSDTYMSQGARQMAPQALLMAMDRLASTPSRKEKRRSFIVTMKKSFIQDDCRLLLPFKHGEKYLKELKDRDITLFVGLEGWIVTVKNTNGQFRFGKGWRKFVEDNQLVKNDVCLFQMNPYVACYEVSIFKE